MKVHWLAVSAVTFAATACMTAGPLKTEPSYPNDWPQLAGLGRACTGVNGTYENDGVAIDEKGNRVDLLLTKALPSMGSPYPRGKLVSLQFVPKEKKDPFSGETWSMGDLLVSVDGSTPRPVDTDAGCFCRRDTLLCTLGVHWEQHNVLIGMASDHSLVAKEQRKGLVPVAIDRWVRFQRVGD